MARPTFFAAPFEYLRFFASFAISLILNIQMYARALRYRQSRTLRGRLATNRAKPF
jgi:hypothetical protein